LLAVADAETRRRLEPRLTRALSACGCSSGAVALLLGSALSVLWWLTQREGRLVMWREAGIAAVAVVVATVLAKLGGERPCELSEPRRALNMLRREEQRVGQLSIRIVTRTASTGASRIVTMGQGCELARDDAQVHSRAATKGEPALDTLRALL
jgi:hypothetical protein